MKAILLTLVALVLAGIIAFFAFQNPEMTTIKLYKESIEASKGLIFIGCTLVGFLIALLWAIPMWIAGKLQIAWLRHKVSKLEKQIGKKEKVINSKDAQLDAKDDALEELSDEVQKQEAMNVIKDAFVPKEK